MKEIKKITNNVPLNLSTFLFYMNMHSVYDGDPVCAPKIWLETEQEIISQI